MYDNSEQRSAVLPIVLTAVGTVLAGMVVRRIRDDRIRDDRARGVTADRCPRPSRPSGWNVRGRIR